MPNSRWKERECATCGDVATTEQRSRLDKGIRPACNLCKSRNTEPQDVMAEALSDLTWEMLRHETRVSIHVFDDEIGYISGTVWAVDFCKAKLESMRGDDPDQLEAQTAYITGLMKKACDTIPSQPAETRKRRLTGLLRSIQGIF